jgi:nucleotide-binding universal stress UspA family protein
MVGLSRTSADPGLIQYAGGIARLGTVEDLRFVHVLPGSDDSSPTADRDDARAASQTLVEQNLRGLPKTVRVTCDAATGPLMDRLLEYAATHQVDLLLVGHRRDHPGRRALARRLAMKAPCSVWMAPDSSSSGVRRIIVPIDFSRHAADTMGVAVALARLAGPAECLALHVYFDESVARFEGLDRVLREEAAQSFQKFMAPIDHGDVAVKLLVEEGANVANAIVRTAAQHEADLIVMGTRGRSRSASILLGSVAEETIIATRIPLLAVKHFGAQLGLLQVLLRREFRHAGNPHTD